MSEAGSGKKDLASADIRRVLKLLPHRYPFLMVDRIVDMDGDESAVGIKAVTVNEPFFQGHFPNFPVMPESSSSRDWRRPLVLCAFITLARIISRSSSISWGLIAPVPQAGPSW